MVETHAIGSLQRYAEDREVQNGSKHFFLAVGMQSAPSSSRLLDSLPIESIICYLPSTT